MKDKRKTTGSRVMRAFGIIFTVLFLLMFFTGLYATNTKIPKTADNVEDGTYLKCEDFSSDKDYRIIYLLTEDIPSSIQTIRKERSDEQGNELWFPMMLRYFDESPYAKKKGISGVEAMLSHFKHRQELEISICKEIFPDRHILLKSKNYKNEDIRVN